MQVLIENNENFKGYISVYFFNTWNTTVKLLFIEYFL